MRRSVVLLITVFLLIIIAGLNQHAMDPEAFSGEWYSNDNQDVYMFRDGLIYYPGSEGLITESVSVSGAYTYSADSIFLFAVGVSGLETEREIYLVQNRDGSFLCENEDGSGRIYFIRYRK